MSAELLQLIKKAAVEAAEAAKPAKILFGTVTGVDPLVITVEQKKVLTQEFLVLTWAVKDHYVDMTVDHLTENASGGSGDSAYAAHNHPYVGRKKFLIHNNLLVGEKVLLLEMQGGQKFVVVDRVVE